MKPSYKETLDRLAFGDFVGPRDERMVAQAEAALGGEFPPSFREFTRQLGAGSYGSFEVYGLIDNTFGGPGPDAVWVTLSERHNGSVPNDAVIVGDSGDGGWYWERLGAEDGPIFLTSAGGATQQVASSFADYLSDRLQG
ncbi:SMI1/KNR4 family protein [Phenylobacterium sp. LjRoot164]|uniref:SMI1/KNR4 family protein n=1 Tax=unclassified Phenylobacterium TaxID=2640670 RepID=UPI003ECCA458